MRIAGCILAGGKSSRMGFDKASVLLGGKTLLAHVVDRLRTQVDVMAINSNDKSMVAAYPIVPDKDANFAGPLAGVLVALQWAKTILPTIDALVTVPVDTPFFPTNLVPVLQTYSKKTIAVAINNGQLHPTVALWPLGIETELAKWLANPENRSAKGFLTTIEHTVVDFTTSQAFDPFMNINTPQDLALAEMILNQS
jgi:molybdenum cofactor guanylyltransferase